MNAEATFRFVLSQLGERWLGSTRARRSSAQAAAGVIAKLEEWNIPLNARTRERLADCADLGDLLERYLLRGVRLDSHLGLLGWWRGSYALEARADIPTPLEMLEAQARGRRYVTLLADDRAHGRFRNAFDFVLHDLEHAHKFFGGDFLGQRGFFRRLHANLSIFADLRRDPIFARDFEYLMSDMNSHPVHLFKYLKAIVLAAELRRRESSRADLRPFWESVLPGWGMSRTLVERALRINQPGREREEDRAAVADFFLA